MVSVMGWSKVWMGLPAPSVASRSTAAPTTVSPAGGGGADEVVTVSSTVVVTAPGGTSTVMLCDGPIGAVMVPPDGGSALPVPTTVGTEVGVVVGTGVGVWVAVAEAGTLVKVE